MGYSEEDDIVRVDFFKESGKWYTTEAVKWTGEYEGQRQSIHNAFRKSLIDHFKENKQLNAMNALYSEIQYPLILYNCPKVLSKLFSHECVKHFPFIRVSILTFSPE
jgi:hypothetical protein